MGLEDGLATFGGHNSAQLRPPRCRRDVGSVGHRNDLGAEGRNASGCRLVRTKPRLRTAGRWLPKDGFRWMVSEEWSEHSVTAVCSSAFAW